MATLNVVYKIAANIDDLSKNVQKGTTMMEGLATTVKRAFAVTAIVEAGQQVVQFADRITNLSQRLGMSTSAVQRLEMAFDPVGVSIEQVGKAASFLANAVIGGDKAAVKALEKLGVNAGTLKEMSMDEMFITVADAVGGLGSQAEKIYASKTLFGRGGVEMLSGLNGTLRETTQNLDAMGVIIDQETIRAADEFGDSLGVMWKQLLGILSTVIGPLLPALQALGQALMWIGNHVIGPVLNVVVKSLITLLALLWEGLANILSRLADLATKVPFVGKHLGFMGDAAQWLKTSAEAASDHVRHLWKETDKTGEAAQVAIPAMIGLGNAAEDQSASLKKATASAAAYRELQNDLGVLRLEQEGKYLAMLDREIALVGQLKTDWMAIGAILPTLFAKDSGQGLLGLITGDALKRGTFTTQVGGFVNDLKRMFSDPLGQIGKGFLQNIGAMISGGLSSLIGAGVSGIGKLFGKLFTDEETQVNPLRDKFIAAAGGLEVLNMKAHDAGMTLDALLRADTVAEYEAAIESLNGAMDFQEQAIEEVKAAMERWGLSVTDMGTKFAQAELDKQALDLVRDFRLLEAAGADVETISFRMADAINAYVRNALAAGVSVPMAMRDIIQQMITQRLLVDDTGRAYESLEQTGLTFSQTMEQEIKDLVGAINKLVEAITKSLGTAIDNIPDVVVDGTVRWHVPDIPRPDFQPIEMARGGVGHVNSPTLFLAGEAGPEDFAFSGANRSFSGIGAAGGGTTVIHTNIQVDGRTLASVVDEFQTDDLLRRRLVKAA